MIQRLQTLWLLLASAFAFLTFKFPFYNYTSLLPANSTSAVSVMPIALIITTAILGALCLFLVFLFKNRKLQLQLAFVALLLSGLNVYLNFYFGNKNPTVSGISLFSVFTFLIPIFIIIAMRNIYRDIRLIKSLDRIR